MSNGKHVHSINFFSSSPSFLGNMKSLIVVWALPFSRLSSIYSTNTKILYIKNVYENVSMERRRNEELCERSKSDLLSRISVGGHAAGELSIGDRLMDISERKDERIHDLSLRHFECFSETRWHGKIGNLCSIMLISLKMDIFLNLCSAQITNKCCAEIEVGTVHSSDEHVLNYRFRFTYIIIHRY